MEQDNFYNTIKEVSNNENKTDKVGSEYIQNNSQNYTMGMIIYNDTVKSVKKEISDLKELNKSLYNETLKEYVEIEISRLENEQEHWEKMYQKYDAIQKYYKGQVTLSEVKQLNDETNKTGTLVNGDKERAEEFLQDHQDIKEHFKKIGIDEDFMICENSELDYKIAEKK